MRYLDAHGKVCRSEAVVHHVYQSGPLKGLKDGTRSYMVNVTKPLGSYHIIDDTKVSIRYRGQYRTCAKCHKTAGECPGNSLAKDCTATRVLLSDAMRAHWEEIGFIPDKSVGYDSTEEEDDILVQVGKVTPIVEKDLGTLDGEYCGIKVVGVQNDENLPDLYTTLLELGLPSEKTTDDLSQIGRTVQIKDLNSDICKNIVKNAHDKNPWKGKKTSIKLVTRPLSSDSESDEADEVINFENGTGSLVVQDIPVNLCKRNTDQLSPSSAEKKREKKKRKQKEKADEREIQILSSQGSVSNRRGRHAKSNP